MAQQHRGPHGHENQQRSWRERFFGDRNEDERNRESESDWEEQGGRRSGYSRGESEQSGWERGADENRWGQSGESRRYQQGQQSGRSDPYGGGQEQSYGSSGRYEQGGYGRSRYVSVNRAATAAAGPTSAKGTAANSNAVMENLAKQVALVLQSGARKNPPGRDRVTVGSTNRSHSTSRIRRVFRANSDHRKARDTALVARATPSTAPIAARAPRATLGLTTA
jgi:hypothetical protein